MTSPCSPRHRLVATHAEVIFVRDGREVTLGCVGDDRPCHLDFIDELARLQVAAQRTGGSILLRAPSTELTDLLALTGLADLLPTEPSPPADEFAGDPPSEG